MVPPPPSDGSWPPALRAIRDGLLGLVLGWWLVVQAHLVHGHWVRVTATVDDTGEFGPLLDRPWWFGPRWWGPDHGGPGEGGPPWGPPWADGAWDAAGTGTAWSAALIGCGVVIGLAVALRGRAPRAAAIAVWLATGAYLFLGGPYPMALVAPAICVFTLARVRPSSQWWIPVVAAAVMIWAGRWPDPWLGLGSAATWSGIVIGVMVIMVPALIRVLRRDHHAALAERRAEELRRVADTERLRLARDVHDVVGHSLSMISLQAGVALHVIDRNPDQVRASLQAIRDASRTSLADLRHTLGALRSESGGADAAGAAGGAGPAPDAVRTPTPDLRSIAQVVQGVRAAGRTVSLTITGDPDTVDAPFQHAAYRIVQESLTNAVRHGHGAAIAVRVEIGPQKLIMDISDDGGSDPGPREVVVGHGLQGITERVRALDGTVHYGHAPAGGFAVHAEIPLPERQSETTSAEPAADSEEGPADE